MNVALVGDYDATVVAQQAIPAALEMSAWQPERSSLQGVTHPLLTEFLMAAQNS